MKARISDAGRDLGIGAEAWCGNMYRLQFRYWLAVAAPEGTFLSGAFPISK